MAEKAKDDAVKETVKKTRKRTPKVEAPAVEVTETSETTETEATEKPKREPSLKETNPEKFLTDFNWHNYEEGIDPVDDGKLLEFEKLVTENFVDTLDDDVVQGEVVHISDRDAIIDLNAKY